MTESKRLNVWIVVFTGNSGLTHYSYCLARALHQAGIDATLVTNKNYDLDLFKASFPVLKVFGRSRRYPVDLVRYWLLYRYHRPDIVHYQSFLKFPAIEMILIKLQKKAGSRVVYTAHDWLPHHRRFYHPALFRCFYRLFDKIVVHSKSGVRFLQQELGVDPERLAVIPHGNYGFFNIDPKLTALVARKRLRLDPDRFWFLFFGRIDPHKGLDFALRALAKTGQTGSGKPPGLIIAGDPAHIDMETYMKLIDQLGIQDRTSLHIGHVPVSQIQIYFRAADAVVLPYRESSTSGVVHLAMGFNKPVIAAAVGGLVDVIIDGINGLLVPVGDEEKLAGAMEKMAGDEDTRRRLQEGWAQVQDYYCWDRVAAKTVEAYESLYQ